MASKEYSGGKIVILWKTEQRIHYGICLKILPNMYNLPEKPWIKLEKQALKNS
jgi:uncharacterized Fe-S cluster protein YjdI